MKGRSYSGTRATVIFSLAEDVSRMLCMVGIHDPYHKHQYRPKSVNLGYFCALCDKPLAYEKTKGFMFYKLGLVVGSGRTSKEPKWEAE